MCLWTILHVDQIKKNRELNFKCEIYNRKIEHIWLSPTVPKFESIIVPSKIYFSLNNCEKLYKTTLDTLDAFHICN